MRNTIIILGMLVFLGVAAYVWQSRSVETEVENLPSQTLPEEHADQKADLVKVVSESIVGRWQSADDAKFVREFRSGGTAVDYYDGKIASDDKWKVFTKEHPVDTFVPLEDNTAYLEMITEEGKPLILKVAKLTPETLELIYMDRGGELTFTKIK